MALTADRNTPRRDGEQVSHPIAADTVIFAGSIVVLDSDDVAAPGATATGLRAVGMAEGHYDNAGGAEGALNVSVRRGVFRYANSAGDAVDRSHIGGVAYIEDDETVSATNAGGNTQSEAGTIIDLDADGVWVEFK